MTGRYLHLREKPERDDQGEQLELPVWLDAEYGDEGEERVPGRQVEFVWSDVLN